MNTKALLGTARAMVAGDKARGWTLA